MVPPAQSAIEGKPHLSSGYFEAAPVLQRAVLQLEITHMGKLILGPWPLDV